MGMLRRQTEALSGSWRDRGPQSYSYKSRRGASSKPCSDRNTEKVGPCQQQQQQQLLLLLLPLLLLLQMLQRLGARAPNSASQGTQGPPSSRRPSGGTGGGPPVAQGTPHVFRAS